MIKKITTGFVVQNFEKDGTLVSQEFIAGDVDYENDEGEAIYPAVACCHPFDMVPPEPTDHPHMDMIEEYAQMFVENADIEELMDSRKLQVVERLESMTVEEVENYIDNTVFSYLLKEYKENE